MKRTSGFSLMELMIVVLIIGILLGISLPAYQGYTLRSHRTDAHSSLLDIAARQERFVAQRNTYTTGIAANTGLNMGSANSPQGYYTLVATKCATGGITTCYLITANAAGKQVNDTGCKVITYSSAGVKSPADCW
jgi:type IV pilus assembly protein PilE